MRGLLPSFLLLFAASTPPAVAQTGQPFRIRGDLAIGAPFPETLRGYSGIPIELTYGELTAEQRAIVHLAYEQLGDDDEPPYPAKGLKPIVRALALAQRKTGFVGEFYIVTDVSPEGEALNAEVFGTQDPQMAKFAASLLMLTRFKPALCAKQPCRQKYPFLVRFSS